MKRRMLGLLGGIAVLAAAALCWPGGTVQADVEAQGGRLEAVAPDGNPLGGCPLKHTDVDVDISGFIARVTVTQRFGNPHDAPIEAVYTFPLSERAAVDRMTMTVGERVIRGVIKEREEARRIYDAARQAGKTASLLDQERPNIFTQSVANIMPGNDIDITISYVEYLDYEDGEYTFSFPMVVGPRYIPGTPADRTPIPTVGPRPEPRPQPPAQGLRPNDGRPTDQVPDADRITPPVAPKGQRAGHDIALAVTLDAGVPIRDIKSELHDVEVDHVSETAARVALKNKKTLPNRDFVLTYKVAGKTVEDALLTHTCDKGGFFTLILQPPDRVRPEEVTPKEMIFVIDCSGSMRGFPIEKAKKTMRMCIEQMNPDDTFNLVSFAGGVGYCFENCMPNTKTNRQKALDYLANLEGRGGTEMMRAILAALGGQDDPERLRIVCFMTDGFIGNDMAILDAVQKNAQTARVFSFGIGNGVNRFLLEGMARMGRGAAEIVTLEADGDEAAQRFHERIHSPVLTDITIDFGGLPVEDVYPDPGALPDLFAAQPLVLKGRYARSGEGVVTVRGNTANGPFERELLVALPEAEAAHDVLAPLWARARIQWLMDQDWLGAQQGKPDKDLKAAVTRLGLDFNLVTQYTSFVAVEEKVVNENGEPKKVLVPVEMTDGVSHEGVFGEEQEQVMAMSYGAPLGAAAGSVRGKALAMSRRAMPQSAPMPAPMPLAKPATPVAVEFDAPAEEAQRELPEPLPEAAPRDREDKDESTAAVAKLHPALRNLAAKLVNGNYRDDLIEVHDGKVEIVIELTDNSDEAIDALKQAGATIKARLHSSKKVLAVVPVEALERLAQLHWVKRLLPPSM